MPPGVPGELSPVIVVHRPEGADHGQVISARADVRPPVADFQATVSVFLVAGAEGHQNFAAAVGGISRQNVLQSFRVEGIFIRSVFNAFAGILVQGRLGVEALNMADAAAQKDPDDRFGFGRKMRLAIRRN